MSRVVLSIGSNTGDRVAHLRSVAVALGWRLVAASGVYETDPWGPVPQGPYLNAVLLAADPDLDPYGWLALAERLEAAAGRVRDAEQVRWGPRPLDVDLVLVTESGRSVRSDDPALVLPHPRAHERGFVLVPWVEVEPGATLPGYGPVTDLLAVVGGGGVRSTGLWLDTSPSRGDRR